MTAACPRCSDGWVVYDDTNNAHTDENDWWSTTGTATKPPLESSVAEPFPPRQYGVQFSDVASDLYGYPAAGPQPCATMRDHA